MKSRKHKLVALLLASMVLFAISLLLYDINHLSVPVVIAHTVRINTPPLKARRFNQNKSKPNNAVMKKSADILEQSTSVKIIMPTSKKLPTANQLYPKDQRPDACRECFRHDFQYLIQNENICKCQKGRSCTVDLVMSIFTIHDHKHQRNNIRATWASFSRHNTANVRHVFLLGKTEDEMLMKSVVMESQEYGDILMEDFTDTYANLTYKTIMAMKWVSLFCSQARFVMKTDDDMWVNVPEVIKMLNQREADLQESVGGSCSLQARPHRNKNSKWYASISSYPHSSYPGFCSGTGYVTSLHVAKKIYEISPNVPFFHLEDVYIALCIQKLEMTLKPLPHFMRGNTSPCVMRSPDVLTSHMVPTNYLKTIMDAEC